MTEARAVGPSLSIRARVLTPVAGRAEAVFHEDARVVVEGGRIVAVEPCAGPRAGDLDLWPRVVTPGFVDAHVHFPQARIVGSATGPLLDWLERTVFPEEARFRDRAYAETVALEFTTALAAAGTTTSMIFSSSNAGATDALFEALDRAGLRAFAGLTLMDQRCPPELAVPAREALAASGALASRWDGHDGARLRFAVTPRFALSCSRGLLEGAAELARARGLFTQTHISENDREGAETLEAHPYARDYAGVYDATGLLGARTMLAHAIHLSAAEWDLIAVRGARVAHCPDSNFFLGSGRMRLDEATRRGVRVALGSDVGGGRSLSIQRAMLHAYDNALCVGARQTPDALLRLATLGGAEALDLDPVIGSVEAGKEADLVALDVPAYAATRAEVLSSILFSDAARVSGVWVRGRRLVG